MKFPYRISGSPIDARQPLRAVEGVLVCTVCYIWV